MSHWMESLYPRLPVSVQNLACSWYGWRESRARFGRRFDRRLEALLKSERWSAVEIRAYQDEQVTKLVRHAYENVPFYTERMRERKLRPDDVRTVADLEKLPVLTKEDVRRNAERMVARNWDRKALLAMHTSGTTGKSLHFYITRDSLPFRWAVWWRHRVRFGVDPGALHANFTGKRAVPEAQQNPPFWRWNFPMRQALLNMQHMTPDKVASIAEFLGSHDFVFYSGYPSVIHAFAASALEAGLALAHRPRFVFTGAENMLDDQRRDIGRLTGAVLSDQYGFSEACGNASHCPELVYHEDFEFGALECADPSVDVDGNVRGSILATGFASPGFPFLRYEVGDVGVWRPKTSACPCGRHSRTLARVEGRIDDYVVTPEGRRIMRFDYIFKDTPGIREAQVVQSEPGAITILVVRRPSYGAAEERRIREDVASWISPRLRVDFEYIDEIPREANGKFRAVKSFLRSGTAAATSAPNRSL